MAIAFVQDVAKLQSTAALTSTITIPATTAGNCLVLCCETAAGTGASWSSIVDDGSNTWTLVGNGGVSGAVATHTAMYVCPNANSVTSVTANLAGVTNRVMTFNLSEWSGVVASSAVEAGSFRAQTVADVIVTTASLTTSQPCLLVANTGLNLGASPPTITPDSPFTALTSPPAASNTGHRIMYYMQSSAETRAGTWSMSTSRVAGTNMVALIPASGGSVQSGSITMSGESDFTAEALGLKSGAATFTGESALTAVASAIRNGTLDLSSQSTFSAVASAIRSGAAAFSGQSLFLADGQVIFLTGPYVHHLPPLRGAYELQSNGAVQSALSRGIVFPSEEEVVGGFKSDGTLK